jgi:Fe2+ or Zn2+ uptake regulation protein
MFFAWPNRVIEKYWGWVDHALVTMCCDEQEQVYVVRDSLECLACDLTPRERKEGHRLSRTSVFDLLKQLLDLKFINRMNIRYGLITCHVHTGEDQSDEWKVAARRFAHEIDPIIHLSLPLRAVRRAWKVTRGFSLSDLWPWIANRLLQLLAKILSPLFRTRW